MFYDSLNGCEDSTDKPLAVSEIPDINMGFINLFSAQMSLRMLTNMVHRWVGWPMGEQSALLGRAYAVVFLLFFKAGPLRTKD